MEFSLEQLFMKFEENKKLHLRYWLIVIAFVILLDIVGNLSYGYNVISLAESLVMIMLLFLFLRLKKFSNKTFYIILYIGATFVVLLSFVFNSYDKEYALFALGMIVASIYFFLDQKTATYWLLGVEVFLLMLYVAASLDWFSLPFESSIYLRSFLSIPLFAFFFAYIAYRRQKQENNLRQTIEGQSFLLREVHHRAKNNLQMIMGILEMEGFNVTDPDCRHVLVNQSNRLKTMSLLHDHLSEIHNLERIDMKAYIESIVEGLGRLCPYQIEARVDAFTAKLQVAVHIALFINEAISNAIKHAYDDKDGGLIECFVDYEKEKKQCHVKIKDYGNKKFDIQTDKQSMGMLLIGDIADRFGVAGVEFHNKDGLEVTCSFQVN